MTPQLGNVYYFQSANGWDFGLFRIDVIDKFHKTE